MSKIFNKNNLKKILTIFILLQPLLDTYILFDEKVINIFKISPSTVIRLLFIFIIAIFSLFVIKSKKQWKWYTIYAITIVLYSLIHLYSVSKFHTLDPNDFNYSNFNEIFYIIRLIIPLFLIVVTSNVEFSKKEISRIFYILFFMFSGMLLLTNLLKISTGAYITKRIEFNIIDWIIKNIHESHSFYDTATRAYFSFANMISSLLFGLCSVLFYKLFKECNLKNFLVVILQMLAMYVLGTKIATFGFILSFFAIMIVYIYFSLIKKKLRFDYKNILVVVVIVGLWLSIYPYSPCRNRTFMTNNNTSGDVEDKDEIVNIDNDTTDSVEYRKKVMEFLDKNYDKYGLKEEYVLKYYPYKYDYMFWYGMLNESYVVKSDNRLLMIKILDRMKDIDSRHLTNELFGVSYSRMSNIAVLEKDFVSQYYSLGLLGSILFTLPLIIILIVCFVKIIIDKEKFKFSNIAILIGFASSLFGAYYCGNTLDNLTFSIIYAFFCGVFINYLFKDKKKLDDKKITILALHLGYGGVEKYISSLCRMLDSDYEIEIISTYNLLNDQTAFPFSNKIKINYLINNGPNKDEFKMALHNKNIIKIIKEGIISVKIILLKYIRNIFAIKKINSKYIITTRVFHNNLVKLYGRSDIVKIATEHNFHNNDSKYINSLINSVDGFDYLVVVSSSLKKYYDDKIKNTKCVYIPNVIENIPNYFKHTNTNNRLISIGRLSNEKGYSDLIEIVQLIKERIPDIKLDIYGDGEERKNLFNKIKKEKLENNISLCGFVPNDEIFKKMKNYDIYVMSSITESFGIVLIEAMSNSLPCIAFDSADGACGVLKNDSGVLIHNRDKKLMADKIIEMLNNLEERNRISRNGHDSISSYYIWNVKEEWIKLLNSL